MHDPPLQRIDILRLFSDNIFSIENAAKLPVHAIILHIYGGAINLKVKQ